MLRCVQSWKRVLGGMAGLVLLPVVLSAQSNGGMPTNETEAIKARQKAELLLNKGVMDNWRKAASYLEKAASLRAVEDPMAIDELVLAAELYNATKWQYRSQAILKSAAEQALDQGRVLTAAQCFVKAAIVANSRHRASEAVALAQKADILARSPHLSAFEAASIRDRIAVVPRKMAADR